MTPADAKPTPSVTFRTTLRAAGTSATGLVVPDDAVAQLAAGKRPAVRVTIGAHTYRSTVAVMGGRYMVGVSAENRKSASISAGDEIDVRMELDTEVRDVVLQSDLAEALAAHEEARAAFERLSYSNKRWHVLSVEGAKTVETRRRRIGKSLELLRKQGGR